MKQTLHRILIIILSIIGCAMIATPPLPCELDALGYWRPKMDPRILPPGRDLPITIFIHGGGKPISSLVSIPGFENKCPPGLTPYYSLCSGCTLGKKVAKLLNEGDALHYPSTGFYIYGWSGVLSENDRAEAGRQLYYILAQIKDNPRYAHSTINVITHSHGGNVALQAARIAALYGDVRPLIDQLVIMGCPVLVDSSALTLLPTFKHKTIILFSKSDPIQVSDPQALYPATRRKKATRPRPLFSGRRFDQNDRIIQAELKTNDRSSTGHLGFVTRKFLKNLPHLIHILQNPRNVSAFSVDECGDLCINFDTKREIFEACIACKSR